MKIALTATAPDLDANVDPRFGRCPYFLVYDTDSSSFEAVENTSAALGGGAGIQAARFIAEHGATTVLTGHCGPNAHQTLSAAGIAVVVGCSGPIREAIEQFTTGQLAPAAAPNVGDHFGMGGGKGMGGGRGMGRGR